MLLAILLLAAAALVVAAGAVALVIATRDDLAGDRAEARLSHSLLRTSVANLHDALDPIAIARQVREARLAQRRARRAAAKANPAQTVIASPDSEFG